jgi:hypothetical protein
MKLKDLIREDRFTLVGDGSHTVFVFDHINGDFGMCYLGNTPVHLFIDAEVEEEGKWLDVDYLMSKAVSNETK